jgi:hypothetical protein
MHDGEIERRIEALEEERTRLRADEGTHAGHDADTALGVDRRRLGEIQVELDQLWDLQRRRRATASIGGDPDAEQLRDAATVENYLG